MTPAETRFFHSAGFAALAESEQDKIVQMMGEVRFFLQREGLQKEKMGKHFFRHIWVMRDAEFYTAYCKARYKEAQDEY